MGTRAQGMYETPDPSTEGQLVAGRYRIERILGRSALGEAALATQLPLGTPVNLDLARFDDEFTRATFLERARAIARFRGTHVARLLDVVELENGALCVAAERLAGRDLATLVRAQGPLPVSEAVLYALMAGDALAEAHSFGVVHGDVAPENMILTYGIDGEPSIKLLGFLAPCAPSSPWPAPPPRAVDDASVDVWGLGAALSFLLGCPGGLEPDDARGAHRRRVPVALENVILRCLHDDPKCRFSSVAELAAALAPFAPPAALPSLERIEHIESHRLGRLLGASPAFFRSERADEPVAEPTGRLGTRSAILRAVVAATLAVASSIAAIAYFRAREGDGRALADERSPASAAPAPEPSAAPVASASASAVTPRGDAEEVAVAPPTPAPHAAPTPAAPAAPTPGVAAVAPAVPRAPARPVGVPRAQRAAPSAEPRDPYAEPSAAAPSPSGAEPTPPAPPSSDAPDLPPGYDPL
jgi:eukaryotic-like serine/threonine-protein kinase